MHQSLKRPFPVWFITIWFIAWPSVAIFDYIEFIKSNEVSIGYYIESFGSQIACIVSAILLFMRSKINILLFGALLAWTSGSILLALINGSLPTNSNIFTYIILLVSVGLYVGVLMYVLKLKSTNYYRKNA